MSRMLLRLTLLGLAIVVAGCGGQHSSAGSSATTKPIGDDPVKVGLGGVAACFRQQGWQVLIVQGHKEPKSVMALPSHPGSGFLNDIPAFWVYRSAEKAAARLASVRADRARRGGTVPQRVGRVIYWWGTTTRP